MARLTGCTLMLGVKTYARNYVDYCRDKVARDVAAYSAVAEKCGHSSEELVAFEPQFFNNMVLVLEQLFVHRLRMVEGKDGNALNEVRMIADSLLENNGFLKADKAIKLAADRSVLKLAVGDEIKLSEGDFQALSGAFFQEIEERFV